MLAGVGLGHAELDLERGQVDDRQQRAHPAAPRPSASPRHCRPCRRPASGPRVRATRRSRSSTSSCCRSRCRRRVCELELAGLPSRGRRSRRAWWCVSFASSSSSRRALVVALADDALRPRPARRARIPARPRGSPRRPCRSSAGSAGSCGARRSPGGCRSTVRLSSVARSRSYSLRSAGTVERRQHVALAAPCRPP